MTIFEQYCFKLNDGNIQKVYDGYHTYNGNKIVHNIFSLIYWDNDKLIIPKSTYREDSCKYFDNIIKAQNKIADKEDLKTLLVIPYDFICIDDSEHVYNGRILNLMLKINGNTRFPMSYKITENDNLLIIYKLNDENKYSFQGILCPHYKTIEYTNIKSM